ncbi:response regulator [Beduini massiliensis]|uniref:response regulator n=1 Tax=Beduini massiliensis TaxID=1585974 RepID=UPI00059A88CB|nr:response regulator transcription factor [Beduini massiliensis]
MKIIIIDDDPLVTSSLKTIIEANHIEVLAVGHSGNEAVELYQLWHPDVVLMDIRMASGNGVKASQHILAADPFAKILFLTTFLDDEYIMEAFKLGIKGYILKQNFDCIVPSLKAVAAGQNVFNTEIISKIPTLKDNKIPSAIEKYELNEKELNFITLVAKGFNNKEIAATLFLSEGTVRNYLSSLLNKLELRDRTQLAIFYYQHLGGE